MGICTELIEETGLPPGLIFCMLEHCALSVFLVPCFVFTTVNGVREFMVQRRNNKRSFRFPCNAHSELNRPLI